LAERPRFAALYSRNFTLLWVGLIVSNAGTQMQGVAQSWMVYEIGRSPIYLGYMGLAFAIPMVALPAIGGAAADTWDRIRLLKVTQVGMMALALATALLTWTGAIRIWHFIAITAINAALLAFDNPTRQAILPELVPKEDLLSAISLNSAAFTGAALFGPALAGILFKPLGPAWLFFLNAVSFLAVLIALFLIRDVQSQPGKALDAPWERLVGGLRYAKRNRTVMALLFLSACTNLFGRSYMQLLPVFIKDIWHVGEKEFGFLQSAAGAGALLGAFGLAAAGDIRRKDLLLSGSLLGFCVILIAFALSPFYSLALGLQVLSGILSTMAISTIATILQLKVPGQLRGRVMSLYTITIIGLSSMGSMGTAYLATLMGAPTAVVIGAAVVALLTLGTAPVLREAGERGRSV